MPASRTPRRAVTDGLIEQLEAAEKVVRFAKLLLGMFAALLLWAARLQWTQADQQRQITEMNGRVSEIQEDRRTKIKDNDQWKHDVEIANVHRDEAIAALARAQTPQAGALETTRSTRTR